MTSELIALEDLGAEIKARVQAGERAEDKAEQHYIAAGIQLAAAKTRLEKTREMNWSTFLLTHACIHRRRADDLIAIGEGRVTLAEHRQKNRERVAAHRSRQKSEPALRNAEPAVEVIDTQHVKLSPPVEDHGGTQLSAQIEALRKKLAKAEALVEEKESQRLAQESRAAIAAKQAGDAANRAMFAEAAKERLAEDLVTAHEEIERLREPGVMSHLELTVAWLASVDRENEDREMFLRKISHSISDWFVPISWFEDCAYELHLARGTPVPEALARKRRAFTTSELWNEKLEPRPCPPSSDARP